MVKLLGKIVFMLLLVGATLLALVWTCLDPESKSAEYLQGYTLKHQLLSKTTTPRLIIIGGSNVAFGIDSEALEQTLNKKVINMGLRRGLGLQLMLDEVTPYLQAGDVVIVIPEYEYFFEHELSGLALIQLAEANASGWEHLHAVADYRRALKYLPRWLQTKMNAQLTGKAPQRHPVYNKGAFNAHGDVVSHLNDSTSNLNVEVAFFEKEYKDKAFEWLNHFYDQAKRKQAQAYFIHPVFPAPHHQEHQSVIYGLDSIMQLHLRMPVLSTSKEVTLPQHYFFDTVYHTNKEGRRLRTNKLIALLQNVLIKDSTKVH